MYDISYTLENTRIFNKRATHFKQHTFMSCKSAFYVGIESKDASFMYTNTMGKMFLFENKNVTMRVKEILQTC